MFALKRVSTSLLLGMAVHAAAAHAETDTADVAAGSVSHETAPPRVIPPPGRADEVDEIVVTADRYGEAKVAAESDFDEAEIASHGADSIQDLLTRLSPFIDPSGEEPVILINGKPTGVDRSILSYPAEALQRVAVLKPEAAAQYGEPAGKRVVNLVLKKQFSMWNADAGVDFATAGGQYGGNLSATRTAINGDTRWNATARIGADSAFRKSARALPPRDRIFDSVGFVSAPDGGEIDPALSLAVGEWVTAAAIPPEALAGAGSGALGLADFAATANALHPVDPDAYETLQSSRRTASLAIGVTRPIGDFSVSLNLNASRSSSEGLRGLPMVSVVIPAGNFWSPFGDDVLLTRPFEGERALRTDNGATSLGASLRLNGSIGIWQTNVGINYSQNWASNLFETGVDVARVQQLIDAGDPGFNPYGPWDDNLLLATRNRTRGENLSARFNVRTTIIDLSAGPLVWNLTANASHNRSTSQQGDGSRTYAKAVSIARQQVNGQMSLSLPISRRAETGPGLLGDLSVDLSASAQTMANSRPQARFAGNVSWSPWPIIQLRSSIDYSEAAPSFDQLDGPIVTAVGRLFDYARQEIAEPVWITGGNPDLRRGSRQSISLAATVWPLGDQVLTFNLGYRQSVAKGGVTAFPELTPAIEAAFPERVIRDGEGRLVAVDARAINIAHDRDAELSSGIALRLGQSRSNARGKAESDPLQVSVAINHGWRLKSELLTRPGLPVIDQLRAGSQSRHNLSLQASVGKRGIGGSLNGNWSSPGRLSGGSGNAEGFIFSPPLTFNLSAFVEPDRLSKMPSKVGLMKDLKISIDIRNLFNGYRRVTLGDGRVPSGYSRNEIAPLGRTVQITVRKRF